MSNPEPPLALVQTYYKTAPKGKPIEVGDVYWAPALFLMETLNALRVEWARPGDDSKFLLRLVTEKEVTLFNHDPIAHPPIRKTEEMLAVKGKRRLVIVLSRPNIPLQSHLRSGGAFPESFLVAPIYTFAGPEDEAYDPEFIKRVRELEYHQFFYLPASEEFGVMESFARLDRIQTVANRQLKERMTSLTQEAFGALRGALTYYLAGPADPNIEAFRQIWSEERAKGKS